MGLFDKIFKENDSQELFEKNNLNTECKKGDSYVPFTELNLMYYLSLTNEKTPDRNKITQEMIDEYKNNIGLLDDNDIDMENLKYFIKYIDIFRIHYNIMYKDRRGAQEGHDFEYTRKIAEAYENKKFTQEIVEGFKIYSKNIEILDNNNIGNDVDNVFRGINKTDTQILTFLSQESIDLNEKLLSNGDLIKIMEYKIKQLNNDVHKYTNTSFSSRSRVEANKLYMLEAKTKIEQYQRNIEKLSNSNKSMTDTMFCRYCGAKIPNDSKFCNECGEKL
ncbi:MAG: zinc ribbon domain-containing protein [Methanobrevibacter sp.]|nr:zinc ribbon domain-containing protein [Methanobrevibacter sp.]